MCQIGLDLLVGRLRTGSEGDPDDTYCVRSGSNVVLFGVYLLANQRNQYTTLGGQLCSKQIQIML